MSRQPHIGIDFSTLDTLNLGNGQYRYVVDLVTNLAKFAEASFVVFGSRPAPVPELSHVLNGENPNWTYRKLPEFDFPGGAYLKPLYYAMAAALARIDVWHAPHSYVPFPFPCPVVVTEHDLMLHLFGDGQFQWQYRLYRWLVQHQATRVICSSECTQRDLLRLFPMPADRVSVIHLGTGFSNGKLSRRPAVFKDLELRLWI